MKQEANCSQKDDSVETVLKNEDIASLESEIDGDKEEDSFSILMLCLISFIKLLERLHPTDVDGSEISCILFCISDTLFNFLYLLKFWFISNLILFFCLEDNLCSDFHEVENFKLFDFIFTYFPLARQLKIICLLNLQKLTQNMYFSHQFQKPLLKTVLFILLVYLISQL